MARNVDRLWSLSSHLQSLSSHRLVGVSAEFGTLGGMLIGYNG